MSSAYGSKPRHNISWQIIVSHSVHYNHRFEIISSSVVNFIKAGLVWARYPHLAHILIARFCNKYKGYIIVRYVLPHTSQQ